jgi:hypothetical protein
MCSYKERLNLENTLYTTLKINFQHYAKLSEIEMSVATVVLSLFIIEKLGRKVGMNIVNRYGRDQ